MNAHPLVYSGLYILDIATPAAGWLFMFSTQGFEFLP